MNRFFFSPSRPGARALADAVLRIDRCAGGETPQPSPEHPAAAPQTIFVRGELEGFPLMLRLYFKPLPAKMPGSQEDSPEMVALGRSSISNGVSPTTRPSPATTATGSMADRTGSTICRLPRATTGRWANATRPR